jgi:hypothetical protein
MVRPDWKSLNGVWEFEPAEEGDPPPFSQELPERILVPFPPESALSGIMRLEPRSWYRLLFEVPEGWEDRRLLLHFGAVNHQATVYVNGAELGIHRGSYDAFSFDITEHVDFGAENELVVGAFNPGFLGGQPVGKQLGVSYSVLFSQSSGIWQPVWLEPVPTTHIERVDLTPDLGARLLTVIAHVAEADDSDLVVVKATARGRRVGRAMSVPGNPIAMRVRHPRPWSPEDPFLYDLTVEVRRDGALVDRVESYFGMRSIALAQVGGATRMVLNGEFVFQSGVLDQGYWPDGLYSAPTDGALIFDIALAKHLGFNMIRKHVKVEPQRWYYWADKLGILVHQDMPNMGIYLPVTPASAAQFELELAEMIDELRSHPSIVVWTPFNEGWGQYDVERVVAATKQRDRSRLFSGNSGSANCCVAIEPPSTDIAAAHLYSGPYAPPPGGRASMASEFGTCYGRDPEHEWDPSIQRGDRSDAAREGLLRRQWEALRQQIRWPGLSGSVFTELYDIEQELSGIYTYDRRIDICDAALVRKLNRKLIQASRRRHNLFPPRRGKVPRGLIAYWSFDEDVGKVAKGVGRRAEDLTLRSGASWAPDGARGGAIDLRGGGQHATAIGPVVDTIGSFTIAAWLRHRDRTQTAAAVAQGSEGAPGFQLGMEAKDRRPDLAPGYHQFPPPPDEFPPWRWTLNVPDSEGCLHQGCGRRANSGYGDGGLLPFENRWQHVIGVVDRDDRTASLYIDGQHITTTSVDHTWETAGVFGVGVDRPENPEGESFNGSIDELRVFDRALSSKEVLELFWFETHDEKKKKPKRERHGG